MYLEFNTFDKVFQVALKNKIKGFLSHEIRYVNLYLSVPF